MHWDPSDPWSWVQPPARPSASVADTSTQAIARARETERTLRTVLRNMARTVASGPSELRGFSAMPARRRRPHSLVKLSAPAAGGVARITPTEIGTPRAARAARGDGGGADWGGVEIGGGPGGARGRTRGGAE